jgi:RNA 3'-terminal phosphate cyclase
VEDALMSALLEIDGAAYSGSGMIVRQAVAYAAVTGNPVQLRHVRAHRPRPGLRRQHLCAVEAVCTLVGGTLEGASLGSREFTFCPAGEVPRGRYAFDVGTAGSATALSLALLPVLATAPEPVCVELTGGLFQDRAPSAFHLQHVLAPLLDRMGSRHGHPCPARLRADRRRRAAPRGAARRPARPCGGGAIRAETIGRATAGRLLEDLRTGAALDLPHSRLRSSGGTPIASDQIIAFTALTRGRSRVRLAEVTDHVRTGVWLTNLFGAAQASLDGRLLVVEGDGRAMEHS